MQTINTLIETFAVRGKKVNSVQNTNNLQTNVGNILTAIITILGVFCVIFVLVGGVQYMTSAGDTAKTEKAKKTILYALIGLVVCALAFGIVQFVIQSVLNNTNNYG